MLYFSQLIVERMVRFIFIVLFSVLSVKGMAQDADSLKAVRKDNSWAIKYTVKQGEYIRMLALRFCISESLIINANDAEDIKKLAPGSVIYIPVTTDNYFVAKQPFANVRELYYEVVPRDDISIVSTYSGVTKSQVRAWNNLKGNTIMPGQVLFIGWVKMIPKDTSNPATLLAYPSNRKKQKIDSSRLNIPGGLDTVYNRQTNNGSNVLTEKGTAVFFEKTGKGSIYLAFHNSTPRGTIIKVSNPGTSKTIYVRVIGPIPDTKQYANCIIGICEAAKEELGVTDNKAWCELSYTAN